MGYNAVAVILTDHLNAGTREPQLGERIQRAVRSWYAPKEYRDLDVGAANSWPYASIISLAHADDYQVTITHGNMGWNINQVDHDKYLGTWALEQMKKCLERNGYRVAKRRKNNEHAHVAVGSLETAGPRS